AIGASPPSSAPPRFLYITPTLTFTVSYKRSRPRLSSEITSFLASRGDYLSNTVVTSQKHKIWAWGSLRPKADAGGRSPFWHWCARTLLCLWLFPAVSS